MDDWIEVSKYIIRVYGTNSPTENNNNADVFLYDNKKHFIGHINFRNSESIYKDSFSEPLNRVYMYKHINELLPVMDMLRNEKPIYLNWDQKINVGFISTSKEPVGEGE